MTANVPAERYREALDVVAAFLESHDDGDHSAVVSVAAATLGDGDDPLAVALILGGLAAKLVAMYARAKDRDSGDVLAELATAVEVTMGES